MSDVERDAPESAVPESAVPEDASGEERRRGPLRLVLFLGCGLFFLLFVVPLLLPAIMGAKDQAMESRVRYDFRTMEAMLEACREMTGELPADWADLERQFPEFRVPRDPHTDAPYLYQRTASGGRLGTLGADGKEGGTGRNADIWQEIPPP